MVDMFSSVDLDTESVTTKVVVCTMGIIWEQIGEVEYKQRVTGGGEMFWERKRTRVTCLECGAIMSASSIQLHMEQSHGVIASQTWGVHMGRGGPTTYVVSFTSILKSVECPVSGCQEMYHSVGRMRENFMYRHFRSKVAVLQEGSDPPTWCNM